MHRAWGKDLFETGADLQESGSAAFIDHASRFKMVANSPGKARVTVAINMRIRLH